MKLRNSFPSYRVADKFLARHTSRCILFDGENISFDASLVIRGGGGGGGAKIPGIVKKNSEDRRA